MDYDPIKDRIGDVVAANPWLTRLFFLLLHVFFLRAWYVRKELRRQIEGIRRRTGSDSEKGVEHRFLRRNSRGGGNAIIRMLDAGTGFGQFADYVARRYPEMTIDAVDIKEQYLTRARAAFIKSGLSHQVDFSVEDLTKLSKSGPYDLILSVDVMEHILDDESVFRNFHRVLRPGGVVIINTPSDQGGSDVQSGGGKGSFIGEHVRDGYSTVEITEKLGRAGLATCNVVYTYGRFGSLAWRFLVKWPMQLLHRSWMFVLALPFYYVLALPPGLVLHFMDMHHTNKKGTGLLVVAEKRSE